MCHRYFSNSLIMRDEKTNEITTVQEVWKCDLNYPTVRRALAWPSNKLLLQVSQSGYANLINGHASLQSPTGKWHNNELLKTCRFVFYEQGGKYPDWLTCKKSLLGGRSKAGCTVKFGELFLWISPRIRNGLRSYMKHSNECFIRFPSTSKLVKKKKKKKKPLGCASFFNRFVWNTLPCAWYITWKTRGIYSNNLIFFFSEILM